MTVHWLFLVAGFVFVLVAAAGGKITINLQKSLSVEIPEGVDRVGRWIAGIVGVPMIFLSGWLLFAAGAETDTPDLSPDSDNAEVIDTDDIQLADDDETRLDAVRGEASDASGDVTELTVGVGRIGRFDRDIETYEFEVAEPGWGRIEVSNLGAESATGLQLFGPDGMRFGNSSDRDRQQAIEGLFVSGTYQAIVVLRDGDPVSYRIAASVERAEMLVSGRAAEGNLFSASDVDAFRFAGQDAEFTINALLSAEGDAVELILRGPRGHIWAKDSPPVARELTTEGDYYVEVRSVAGWTGTYEIVVTEEATPEPTSTPDSVGLPESIFGLDGVEATEALLEAGFVPRMIPVCGETLDDGLVRQVVLEEVGADGRVVEVVLDSGEGLTETGEGVAEGSEVAVQVSTGDSCSGG